MNRYNKHILIITILITILILTGCKNIRFNTFKSDGKADTTKTEAVDKSETGQADNNIKDKNTATDDASGTVKGNKSEGADSNITPTPAATEPQPVAEIELLIYTVNSDAQIEPKKAMIPKDTKITPQLIVETVVSSMADNSRMIGIDSVDTQDDKVIVNFKADQPPLKYVGAGVEAAILDSIAQSLSDNGYDKVIFRVEGKAYQSDHIEMGIDEVYLN